MDSRNTKTVIAESFIDLTAKKPFDKVCVSDIIAASGYNRKTFYYHFADKRALVVWVFRSDLAKLLLSGIDTAYLVYEQNVKGALSEFPYYAFIKEGVRSLDGSPFLRLFAACFENRRDYYAQALADTSADGLPAYLRALYTPALRNDIEFILSNRYLPERNIRFLAEFYVDAIIAFCARRCADSHADSILQDIGPFANIIHSSIAEQIKEQQRLRTL